MTEAVGVSPIARHFAACAEAFSRATRLKGIVERNYSIAGAAVRLRFAGEALVNILHPALSHLEAPGGSPVSLSVDIWDTGSTGVPFPGDAVPASNDGFGEPRFFVKEAGIEAFYRASRGSYGILDTASGQGFLWFKAAGSVRSEEYGKPLREFFQRWAAARNLQFVHGGAVGTVDGGVLLAGKGGSGKSTTALACLSAGLLYAGDDYILIEPGPVPIAHSLYGSAFFDTRSLDRFPALKAAAQREVSAAGKSVLQLSGGYRGLLAGRLPLRALLLPERADRPESRLVRVSGAAGLTALAPSCLFQCPGAEAARFGTLAAIAKSLPCYRLELGTDLGEVADRVRDLISGRAEAA